MLVNTFRCCQFLVACLFILGVNGTCNADKYVHTSTTLTLAMLTRPSCYRAMFPCPSPSAVSAASAFCATITANGTTATNFPTRATSACGSSAARYISACKCGPTCTSSSTSASSTCTANPTRSGVLYGDFECSVTAPWTLQLSDPSTITGSVNQPGLTGNWAVEVEFANEDPLNASLTSPTVTVNPSTQYKLTWGLFVNGNSGDQTASVNGRGTTINANQYLSHEWVYTQIPFTTLSTETTAQVAFGWETLGGRLDTVSLSEVTAWCGSNPPLGNLPDGEFECGIGAWTVEIPDPSCQASVHSNSAATGGALGSFAWLANQTQPPVHSNTDKGVNARILTPPLPVVPGETYMLSFVTYFTGFGVGFIGVLIDDVPVYTRDPGDKGQNGPTVFSPNTIFWTAPPNVTTATVNIEALFAETGTMMVDGVIFTQVNSAWAGTFGG